MKWKKIIILIIILFNIISSTYAILDEEDNKCDFLYYNFDH